MSRYPAHIAEFMSTYGVRDDEVWPVPGGKAYAVKHSALERIAAEKRIEFQPPQIVEGDTASKTVTLIVYAQMGDIKVWSFGEVNPSNNKNAYVWSMAEKRGKDRCILKLLNIHGAIYSDDEIDMERDGTPNLSVAPLDDYVAPGEPEPFPGDAGPRKSAHSLRKDQPQRWSEIVTALRSCVNVEDMRDYAEAVKDETAKWPDGWLKELRTIYRDHADSLTARAA